VLAFLFILLAASVYGQERPAIEVSPLTVPQGGVIRVKGTAPDQTARMNGRSIRLFPQTDGPSLGLMPIPSAEKPGVYDLQVIGKDGQLVQSASVTVRDAHFRSQNIVLNEQLSELKPAPGETEEATAFRNNVSNERYWTEPLKPPVPGCLTSPFGVKRLHNGKVTGDYHAGVDQRSPAGGPIRAVTGGVVKLVREWRLHGNTVAIDHGQGVETIYLHMSKFATKEGAVVHQGDVIGYIGSTGRSTGPHLHWSMYVNGVPVNPALWIHVQDCAPAAKKARGKK
jgi:murein DD-endopeptidase MepM/ murein hydrolase activator NlpD